MALDINKNWHPFSSLERKKCKDVTVESDSSIESEKRALRWKRYEIMRDIRNGLRKGVEQNTLLTLITERFYIEPMSLEEVYVEDVDIDARTMLRTELAAGSRSTTDNDFRAKRRKDHDPVTRLRAQMEQEQYARHVGAKMMRLLQDKNLAGAKDLYEGARDQRLHLNNAEEVDKVCILYVIDALHESYAQGDYFFMIDILMTFGDSVAVEGARMIFMPADFEDFLSDAGGNKSFIEAMSEKISHFFVTRPDEYVAIRKYFENLGFLKGLKVPTPPDSGVVFVGIEDEENEMPPPAS